MKKYIKFFKDVSGSKLWIEKIGKDFWVHFKGRNFIFNPQEKKTKAGEIKKKSSLSVLLSPIPGRILSIRVQPKDSVKEGEILIVLESMKIEHKLTATKNTNIKSVLVQEGQSVGARERLIEFE